MSRKCSNCGQDLRKCTKCGTVYCHRCDASYCPNCGCRTYNYNA